MVTKFKRLLWDAAAPAALESGTKVRNGLARGGLISSALEAGSGFCKVPHAPL